VNASIRDKDDGSNGLYGVINSTKNEQKKIITSKIDETIAVGDLIKLKYISLSFILSQVVKDLLSTGTISFNSYPWIDKII
tara:strand:+ start:663 stop:905 length:243 start_codon:yes stop_codon:yes gene_type:complete